MYKQIVIGYDGSAQADDALAFAKRLAAASGASLTAVTVGRRSVTQPNAVAETIEAPSPARGLQDFVEQRGADLLVLGSAHHGRVGQILAGSVAMSLLHGSPCAVAIAPLGYAAQESAGIEEVAIGYDGKAESQAALADAVELARATVAPLKVVTVAAPPPVAYGSAVGIDPGWNELKEAVRAAMQEQLDAAVASVPGDVRVTGTLVEGMPAESLARIAVADGGVLVVGSRAYGPLRRVLLGSVSTELVRSAPCPLIVHPRPALAEAAPPAPNEAGTVA